MRSIEIRRIVDPIQGTVEVSRREGDRLVTCDVLSRAHDGVLKSPLLPGFEIALTRVFRTVPPT